MRPVDAERQPVGSGTILDDHGSGAVGEHEAEELGVEGGSIGVGEATGAEGAAHQLGADRHRHLMPTECDRGLGRPQRGDPRAADTACGEHLHGPAAETPVHHRGEPGDRKVALGGPGGQHPDVLRGHSPVLQCGANRGFGQLLVEHQGPALTIDGVVTLLDPVGFEHPTSQPVRPGARRPDRSRSRRCRSARRAGTTRRW